MSDTIRIHRKEAVGMDQSVSADIKSMTLAAGLNTQRIFAAWDAWSGAASCTLRRFFRGGKLYITLNSSVVRNQLYFQREVLVEKMNAFLSKDSLFTPDNHSVGFIQELILK